MDKFWKILGTVLSQVVCRIHDVQAGNAMKDPLLTVLRNFGTRSYRVRFMQKKSGSYLSKIAVQVGMC